MHLVYEFVCNPFVEMSTTELNIISIEQQCRICLEIRHSKEEMTSLFQNLDGEFTLANIVKNISNFEIIPHDDMPGNICDICLTTIVNFHNLLLQCRESEDFFMKHYVEAAAVKKQLLNSVKNDISNIEDEEIHFEDPDEHLTIIEDAPLELKQECVNGNDEDALEEEYLNNDQSKVDQPENKQPELPVPFEEVCSQRIISENDDEIVSETLKYSCKACGDCFLLKAGFHQHMLQKHSLNLRQHEYHKYSSKVIVKQPKASIELIIKMMPKHANALQCRICKECFDSAVELKDHMNIHKTHLCPVCGMAFLKKYYLTDHLVLHSTQKDYECNICKAKFRHRHGLTAHRNSHKTFRDNTCETCGMGFKDRSTLNIHFKLKHTNIRNFACTECPLRFKLKSFLDKHFLRKHTERTKDFVCKQCGVSYLNKTTLLRHVTQKHSGKMPLHTCPACNKSFSWKVSLNKHLQTTHESCFINA